MTLRTKTLSAVSALLIGCAGVAAAQTATTEAPAEAPAEQQVVPAPDAGTPAETTATEPTPETAPTEEPAAAPVAEEPAAEPAAEEPAAAPPAETAPTEAEAPATAPVVEEPAAEPAAAEPAAEPAAEEPAATEATEPAAQDDAATDAAPADEPAADTPASEPEAAAADSAEAAETEAAETEDEATEGEAGDTADEAAEHAGEEEHAEEGAAAHDEAHIEDINYSFEGPFGTFNQFQLQRGLQVYTEVCSACHGMKQVPIRTLADEGGPALPEDQVRAYAANMTIIDPETGEERPRLPTDHFPQISGLGMGPDLSLMAKARAGFHGPYGTGISQLFNGIGGPEYIHAILTGYTGEEIEQAGTVLYQNTAFPGGNIAMPPPLSDDLVTYEDGTPATVDQMARDVSAFLMWAAEPRMMARKQVGLVAVLFLIVLSGLLYYTNKRIWAPHKGKH